MLCRMLSVDFSLLHPAFLQTSSAGQKLPKGPCQRFCHASSYHLFTARVRIFHTALSTLHVYHRVAQNEIWTCVNSSTRLCMWCRPRMDCYGSGPIRMSPDMLSRRWCQCWTFLSFRILPGWALRRLRLPSRPSRYACLRAQHVAYNFVVHCTRSLGTNDFSMLGDGPSGCHQRCSMLMIYANCQEHQQSMQACNP